ncbi:MAG: hypothetical protein DWQ10_08895 [Calditrichaeota bacterium]|nr:MAG: hypothetical protein DWQ10_08895 [Calditrichota bacterium]
MKYMKTLLTIMLVTLFIHGGVYGQGNNDKSGTTAAPFLKICVGARAMGMAGAMAGQSDDVYSMYWNPSAITKVGAIAFSASQADWFADITHNFVGMVIPMGEDNAIGFYGIFLDMDPIQVTTIDAPHGTGEFFKASDLALGVTYARKPVDFLSLGVGAKFIQQSIFNETASTFAFDLSSVLDIPYKGMKLGMNFSNIGGKMRLDGRDLIKEFDLNPDNTLNTGVEAKLATQHWDLPVNFRVGVAMDIVGKDDAGFMQNEKNRLTMAIDGNHPADAAEHVNLGMEYSFNELISLRGGYQVNRDIEELFYGAGINASLGGGAMFRFDYAVASFGDLDYIHVFSGSISFK